MNKNTVDRTAYSPLKGRQFKVDRYDCIWTVRCYERNNSWTCSEPDYNTTCQFYESEIKAGLLNKD